jgi:hypothetical protein
MKAHLQTLGVDKCIIGKNDISHGYSFTWTEGLYRESSVNEGSPPPHYWSAMAIIIAIAILQEGTWSGNLRLCKRS